MYEPYFDQSSRCRHICPGILLNRSNHRAKETLYLEARIDIPDYRSVSGHFINHSNDHRLSQNPYYRPRVHRLQCADSDVDRYYLDMAILANERQCSRSKRPQLVHPIRLQLVDYCLHRGGDYCHDIAKLMYLNAIVTGSG